MSESYNPRGKNAAILTRAIEIVGSVPYQVSTRWVFYRLLQDGYYAGKADYKNKSLPAVSSAQHSGYGGWRPDTLTDETRSAIVRGDGYVDPRDWLANFAARVQCQLNRWQHQPYYVEQWYEACSMTDQFRYYTQYATLRPMGGQPSFPFKYETPKELEIAQRRYDRPVVVLYFGDLDEAGAAIARTVEQEGRNWRGAPFEFIRCGLNESQVARYNLPENFEHPGSYQWEALSDDASREIITSAMDGFVSHDASSVVADKELKATRWLRSRLAQIADEYSGGAASGTPIDATTRPTIPQGTNSIHHPTRISGSPPHFSGTDTS